MTENTKRFLHVFLCHASEDKPTIREVYQLLTKDGISVWLDEEELLPGQDWEIEIEKAIENADVVIVCLSNKSVSKEGYVQREVRYALDIALEKPENTIFVIPLKLDDCQIPRRLRSWQWLAYFPANKRKAAYKRLLQSLQLRADSIRCSLRQSVSTPAPEPGIPNLPPASLEDPSVHDKVEITYLSEPVIVTEPDSGLSPDKVLARPKYKGRGLFVLSWILASLTGLLIGEGASVLGFDLFTFPITWLAIGLGQWLLLRKRVSLSGWWVLVSGLGATVAAILLNTQIFGLNSSFQGITSGIFAGVGQWLILRKHVRNAGWWIGINVIGWVLGWAFVVWPKPPIITSLIIGIVAGGSTGGVLLWLLGQSNRKQNG